MADWEAKRQLHGLARALRLYLSQAVYLIFQLYINFVWELPVSVSCHPASTPIMWKDFGTFMIFCLTITFLWCLAAAILTNVGTTSRLKCDWDDDPSCVKTTSQNAQYYLKNDKEIWWELAFFIIILSPIATTPYMLAECLKTHRFRYSDRFEWLTGSAILYLDSGRYMTIPLMFALVLLVADTESISKAEGFGEGAVSFYIPFSSAKRTEERATGLYCEKSNPNFDIVGPGVRLSTYVLLIFTVLSLTIGSWHARTLGTKELGICTLLSKWTVFHKDISRLIHQRIADLFGTAFNVVKLKKDSLSPTEVFVAIALIDAQIVSLTATLSSKDALASRWYVRLTIACVITAWVSVAVLGHGLKDMESYIKDSICCVPMHEWPSGSRWCDFSMYLAMMFPYYWYSHGLDLTHTLWLAYRHTTVFDSLEKLSKREDDQEPADTNFSALLPATAFSAWRGCLCHPFLVIIAIERHLTAVDQTNLAEWQAWGQSLTLCVCIGGLFHWLYVNRELILHTITRGRYGAWSSTQLMLPTDIVRYVAMGFEVRFLNEENRHLLATGHSSIVKQQSDDNATPKDTLSENSEPPETLRPTIAHLRSADIIDQISLAKRRHSRQRRHRACHHLPKMSASTLLETDTIYRDCVANMR